MELNEFVAHFAEQFEETDASVFTPETKYHDLEEWSSLIGLSVIAMVDDEYDVTLKGNDGGCIVEGTVENSILFRGVRVEKGAVVKDSIIMQDGLVKAGAELQHCILDKQATIRENTRLLAPRSYPIVITKNMIV